MDRQPPRATSDEIDLYIRTYYSLLRSSGDVRVRAFEEAHLFSRSSLHLGAEDPDPDLAAFAYSAARLPDCMPRVRRIVLGQSLPQFADAGFPVESWQSVRTRGRRRPLRWDGKQTLAVFIASGSDIDDLIPILTAYQIEWNKVRERLVMGRIADVTDDIVVATALGTDEAGVARLRGALGAASNDILRDMIAHDCDLFVRLLDGSFREYQRQATRWWNAIAPSVPANRPIYFVSSNSHSLANLLGGYARAHGDEIVAFLRRRNFEDLVPVYEDALAHGDESLATNILYYSLRSFIHESGHRERMDAVQESDLAGGLRAIMSPGKIDVDAQVIELGKLRAANLDPRVRVPGIERLASSDALIINIDYPLGMAAFHHLSAIALGVDELRGIYIMGKAATLNGRVGDVMISKVIHDEHSSNTYLFRNALTAADVQPFMRHGTVLDNQKALTVRSAFLQNREYMDVFYREGYTVMEMEAGPYLSASYEIAEPKRHPKDEIVSLVDQPSFELGVIHYASDTPYSRRQSLLSKSLSYFGMECTYGCAIAIARRIFTSELREASVTDVPDVVDVVVVGAGVSGLGFANWWLERNPDERVVVLEAEPEPGGYCRTVVRDGFVWDYSGHFFHFKDPAIETWLRARMPGQDVRTVERVAKIRYAGIDIDFPFQKHIHQLPRDEFLECLVELYFRPHGRPQDGAPASFGEMLYQRLGKGITDKFLRPYNEKLYATDLDTLDPDAMGRFFPHADIADIIANMRPGARAHGYNATFTYPAGGAVQYIHALMRDLPTGVVACGEPVTAIDLDARTVTTPKRTLAYKRVVSSAPLPALARLAGVAHDPTAFTSNKVLVWNLGFDKKGMTGIHWLYVPDPSLVFYRVGWYDNIIGGDRMSLYVEVGAANDARFDVTELRARVLADLVRAEIVTDQTLVAEHHVVLDPAYVHITRASLAETQRLRAMFSARGVHSVGRYGAWTYCSIEDNLLETRALARSLPM